MTSNRIFRTSESTTSNWLYYLLILLIVEKIIQHIFVTFAFYFNWADIASTVVVSPNILMILGALVTILFALSLWGMIVKQMWVINLIVALALFDILGEFVAQGKIAISITMSFLVAALLLLLSLLFRSRTHQ